MRVPINLLPVVLRISIRRMPGGRDDFLMNVHRDGFGCTADAAARSVVKSGDLRQADADAMIKQAEESGVLR